MADTVDVRVVARDFIYEGETYARDKELTVDEQTFENHQRSLKPLGDGNGEHKVAVDGADANSEDLEEIDGVGSKTADKLRDAGYETLADVRDADPDALAEVEGVSDTLAANITSGQPTE